MKKMIATIFLAIVGILNIQAQTGTVNRKFYMDSPTLKVDTCYLTLEFEKGIATGLAMTFNHKEKGTYILAFISGKPNMYHSYKTTETRIQDFKNLLDSIQTKYKEWSNVAKSNKIVKFKKEIGTFKNIPILTLNAYNKQLQYFQKTEVPYIDECKPYFDVDEKGYCKVFFGWNGFNFERTKGYNQGFWTSYPIKEQLKVNDIYFQFASFTQLQSLIDALDIETAKQELLKKSESNKDLDNLFK